MTEKITVIYQSIQAIYKTITQAYGLVSAIGGWFGFTAIVVLIGFLFFYKIFSAIFPDTKKTNTFLAVFSFTALWVTWNNNYFEGELHIFEIVKTYGFISLNIGVVLIIHTIIRYSGKSIVSLFKKRKLKDYPLSELYEMVDRFTAEMKNDLKNGSPRQATEKAGLLAERLQRLPATPRSADPSGENSHT